MKFTHRLFLLVLIAACAVVATSAQTPRDDFEKNIFKSASNYYAYPYLDIPTPELTPAPEGYKPFHINHYGRHGSRWLIDQKQYQFPVDELLRADAKGKLTQRGKLLLSQLQNILSNSNNRLGELTDKGADQIRGIAQRMCRNFPDVFAQNATVDARSSVVVRCILSMSAALNELYRYNPMLRISQDASQADMHICANTDSLVKRLHHEKSMPVEDYIIGLIDPTNLNKKLFTDQQYATDSINGKQLMIDLWDITSNQQSHYTETHFFDLFEMDDVMCLWNRVNTWWYAYSAYSKYTDFRAPYSQYNLLRDFLATASDAVNNLKPHSTLRYGHESCLLPLACLMELNNSAVRVNALEDLPNVWQNYNFYPMGSNIQWVFYKKEGSNDIIMKVLLNEAEATLHVKTDIAPYYHWDDVKRYYTEKLDNYSQNIAPSDVFATPGGKQVRITHIKHGTLMIQFDNRTLHIDPVAKAIKSTDYSLYPKADLILITHEHHDHFDKEAIAMLCTDSTRIIANKTTAPLIEGATMMLNGNSTEMLNIGITAVTAYNTTPKHKQFHKKGNGNGYVLNIDGLKIYIAGDTEPIAEMKKLKDIDIAFLPVNQPYTMTVDQCIEAAKIIKPRTLIPYHFGNSPVNEIKAKLECDEINVLLRNFKH